VVWRKATECSVYAFSEFVSQALTRFSQATSPGFRIQTCHHQLPTPGEGCVRFGFGERAVCRETVEQWLLHPAALVPDRGAGCSLQVRSMAAAAGAAGIGLVGAGPTGTMGVATAAAGAAKGSNTVFAWALLALTILLEVRNPPQLTPRGGGGVGGEDAHCAQQLGATAPRLAHERTSLSGLNSRVL
jgi:hypothetical protein